MASVSSSAIGSLIGPCHLGCQLVFVNAEWRLDQRPPNIALHHDVRPTATTPAGFACRPSLGE
jgi:hypothetical protein